MTEALALHAHVISEAGAIHGKAGRKSTVSDGVRKLGEQGLVEHKPYGAVELTDTGRTYAVAMIPCSGFQMPFWEH